MRLVRVGLGSIDTTVGAFRENTDRALALAYDMAADGVTIGVFPEQAIGGYPVEDLIQWQGFVERQWPELERFARETASLAAVFVIGVSVLHAGLRYNCAATIAGGSIRSLTPKEKLPTYHVFYEGRTVSRGVPGAIGDVLAVPAGRGADPARADRDPRRRLPVLVRLRQSRRFQRRVDLRRRRLPQPERQVDAGGAALAPGVCGGDHRPRSHHPAAGGEHHLAYRRGGVPDGAPAGDDYRRAVRRAQHGVEPRHPDLPGARQRLVLPPGTRAPAIAA